jgi:hypothetical protein
MCTIHMVPELEASRFAIVIRWTIHDESGSVVCGAVRGFDIDVVT